VDTLVRANVTNDADFRFFVVLGPAKNEFLLRRQLMPGEDAGTVQAEEDGFGGFGKHTAVEIAPDEENGDFLRDAAAPAHNLLGQGKVQSGVWRSPI